LETFIAAADKKLEDYLKQLHASDTREHRTEGSRVKNLAEKIEALKSKRGEYAAHLATLETSGESQISLTDPDSRAMGRVERCILQLRRLDGDRRKSAGLFTRSTRLMHAVGAPSKRSPDERPLG
jgi:hypothetical protein